MLSEKKIDTMLSMDIYNIMLEKESDSEYRMMAWVLNKRNETQLLYSILINK